MTKSELESEIFKLQKRNEMLEDKVAQLRNDADYFAEIEENAVDTINKAKEIQKNCLVKDWDDFITRMKIENLYTQEIEDFINDYIKFYN